MILAAQEHLLPGEGLEQKWEAAQELGFDAIELIGKGDLAFEARLDELQAASRAGVGLQTVCVNMDHFIGDFDAERRRDAIVNMKSLLSTIGAIGGRGAVTPASYGMFSARLPPYTPPRSAEDDRKVLLEGLHQLGEHAAREDVLVLLEPLNRYEDHMLNRLEQAVGLCRELGNPAVRVMADLYHMNIEEADPPQALRHTGDLVAHVHLADSNRLQPGAGHLDFAGAFAALRDIGFEGVAAMECGLAGDRREALASTSRLLRPLMG